MAILWLPLDCALLGIRKTASWVPVTGLILPGASHDWGQGSEGTKSRKSQHFSKSTCSCGTWPGLAQAYLVISFGFVLFSQVPRACATNPGLDPLSPFHYLPGCALGQLPQGSGGYDSGLGQSSLVNWGPPL